MAGVKRTRPGDDEEEAPGNTLTNYGHIQNQAAVQQFHGSVYNGPVYATYANESAFSAPQQNVRRHTEGDKRRRLLRFLHFNQIEARRRNIKAAYSKTCRWLLDHAEYEHWLDDESFDIHHGILWIKGKPGTGKSTITKFAYMHMKNEFPDVHVISFFFTARGSSLEQSTSGMYRSLLLQLLEMIPDLQPVLDSFWDPSMDQIDDYANYEWALEVLQDILRDVIQRLHKREVFCFVDALDECKEQQVRQMVQFFEEIGQLATDTGIRFRTCFSSRHYPHISINKCTTIILEHQDGHQDDIDIYLAGKLKIGSTNQAHDIRQNILARASGVFLWVVLVTEILNTEYDRGQVHSLSQRLDDIQDDLGALFHDILTRDGRPNRELMLCIQFVIFAQRPLRPQELYFAVLTAMSSSGVDFCNRDGFEVSEQDMRRFILHSSKGLVDITKGHMPVVQCIHESVRNFFMNAGDLQTKLFGPPEQLAARSHDQLANCCHTYYVKTEAMVRSQSKATDSKSGLSLDYANIAPFFDYSVQYVFHHCDKAQGLGLSQSGLLEGLDHAKYIECFNFLQRRQRYNQYPVFTSRLTIFAERNLANLILLVLDSKPLIDTFDEKYGHPMFAAHRRGNEEALKALLSPCALSLCKRSDNQYQTTITSTELEKAMEELLSAEKGDYEGHTTLTWPVIRGMCAVVKCLLVGAKADVNRTFRDDIGQTLRAYKSLCEGSLAPTNREKVQSFLMRNESLLGGHYFRVARTPLHLATRHTQLELMRLLLAHESIDVNKQDGIGNTPLHYAAQNGSIEAANFLLQHERIDVNQQNPKTRTTPLHEAVEFSDTKVLQLLLARADTAVNAQQSLGMTALHLAAATHSTRSGEMVSMLLARPDIEADKLDMHGRTPLYYAETEGHWATVMLFMKHFGTTVSIAALDRRTTLSRQAILLGDASTLWSFSRNQNAQFNDLDLDDPTLLHLAVRHKRANIVRILVQNSNIKLDLPDATGQTALDLAYLNGSTDIATLISTAIHQRQHNPSAVEPHDGTYGRSRSATSAWLHISERAID